MPKTRLLTADRDFIREAVIARKFDPIQAALTATEGALAEEVRRWATGSYLATMEKAPAGAFCEDSSLYVNVNGARLVLYFGGVYPDQIHRRVMHKHAGHNRLDLERDSDLATRIEEWAAQREAVKKDRNKLDSETRGTLEAFRTFDDLLNAWPQAEKFIKARWQTRPEYTANVPAIRLTELAASLDLPPEELEAA